MFICFRIEIRGVMNIIPLFYYSFSFCHCYTWIHLEITWEEKEEKRLDMSTPPSSVVKFNILKGGSSKKISGTRRFNRIHLRFRWALRSRYIYIFTFQVAINTLIEILKSNHSCTAIDMNRMTILPILIVVAVVLINKCSGKDQLSKTYKAFLGLFYSTKLSTNWMCHWLLLLQMGLVSWVLFRTNWSSCEL